MNRMKIRTKIWLKSVQTFSLASYPESRLVESLVKLLLQLTTFSFSFNFRVNISLPVALEEHDANILLSYAKNKQKKRRISVDK